MAEVLKTTFPRNIVLRNCILGAGLAFSLTYLFFSENFALVSSDLGFYSAIAALISVALVEFFIHKRHAVKFDEKSIYWTRAGLPHPWAKEVILSFSDISAVTSIEDHTRTGAISGVLISSMRTADDEIILARGYLGDEGIRAVLCAIEQHGFRDIQDDVRHTFLT